MSEPRRGWLGPAERAMWVLRSRPPGFFSIPELLREIGDPVGVGDNTPGAIASLGAVLTNNSHTFERVPGYADLWRLVGTEFEPAGRELDPAFDQVPANGRDVLLTPCPVCIRAGCLECDHNQLDIWLQGTQQERVLEVENSHAAPGEPVGERHISIRTDYIYECLCRCCRVSWVLVVRGREFELRPYP